MLRDANILNLKCAIKRGWRAVTIRTGSGPTKGKLGGGGRGVAGATPPKIVRQQYQMIQRFDYMENNNFERLLDQLAHHNRFTLALQQAQQRYLIKSYKISEFSPIIVCDLYGTLQQKFYLRRTKPNEDSWFENQLRIYIWLLAGYLYIHERPLDRMTQVDWEYFVPIFNHRSYTFFEYQSISLLKHSHKSPKWAPEEAALLEQIIESKNYKNKWNSIARELYNRSNKRFYRNPKQCREHWMNHLDPVKVHSQWTVSEDLTLLTTVRSDGKKWSLVVKRLLNTRTEHMVKNRYKSLICNELKRHPHLRESEIQTFIISKLEGSNNSSCNATESKKLENIQPQKHAEERQLEQPIKSQKPSLRKGSNMSEGVDGSIDSPRMIQLSESDFLNSPLPIPWGFGAQNLDDYDSAL